MFVFVLVSKDGVVIVVAVKVADVDRVVDVNARVLVSLMGACVVVFGRV